MPPLRQPLIDSIVEPKLPFARLIKTALSPFGAPLMKIRVVCAVLAATALVCQFTAAQATCVISPDHKSISVVTDNGASDEKTCSVSCKVDTKVGVLQVSCGGTTPPLAKGHALCGFDKPDAFYNKVVSSEDSCKGGAAEAPAAVAPVVAA